MTERDLARFLFGFGMIAVSVLAFFGPGWADAGTLARAAFVVGVASAVVGLGLDVKHRRHDKRRVEGAGS